MVLRESSRTMVISIILLIESVTGGVKPETACLLVSLNCSTEGQYYCLIFKACSNFIDLWFRPFILILYMVYVVVVFFSREGGGGAKAELVGHASSCERVVRLIPALAGCFPLCLCVTTHKNARSQSSDTSR